MMDFSQMSDEELLAMRQQQEQQEPQNPYHPINEMSDIEKFIAGMGRSVNNIGQTIGGWIGDNGVTMAESQRLDAPLLASGAGGAGNLAGEIMATAPLGMGAGAAIGRGMTALAPRMVAGSGVIGQGIGRGAVEGAVEAGLTGGDVGAGGGFGAAIGGVVPAIGRVSKWMGQPTRIGREAQAIQQLGIDQGIPANLTVGQMADPGNFTGALFRNIEQMSQNMPGNTALLRNRQNAVRNWNLAEIRNALPTDLSKQVTNTGTQGMRQAQDALSGAYDDVLSGIRQGDVVVDQQALDGLIDLEQNAVSRLDEASVPAAIKQIRNLFDDLIGEKMDGRNIKKWEKRFREKAEKAGRDGDGDLQDLYFGMRDVVRGQRDRVLGPQGAARMAELDQGYARMVPITNASSMIGAVRGERFTPDQLASGAQQGLSRRQKAAARNPMIDRAAQANEVFGTTLPQVGPGTAEKLMMQGVLGGGAATAYDLANGGEFSPYTPFMGALASMGAGQAASRLRNPAIGNTLFQGGMRRMQPGIESLLNALRPGAVAAGVLSQE